MYLCYIIYLYVCTNEDVYIYFVRIHANMLLATGSTAAQLAVQVGVMHYIIHFVICLHCS